jgi:release factor glutamine methyltransferase
MDSMKQVWEETTKQLEKIYERREAENISYLLLEDVFRISKSDVMLDNLQKIDLEKLQGCIGRLLSHEPLQYVTGLTYFFGRKFHIQKGALIPRPETEELVRLIIDENVVENPKILDVGIGSGCIAISLAKELKGEVSGTDVSEDALAIARNNAKSLDANVSFSNHDVLVSDLAEKELDILVSNPPYIPNEERALMNENVIAFEPETALFVPDNDPIVFYKRIAEQGLQALKKGGKLYFEIHENFGTLVKEYLEKIGYSEVKIIKDMQGKERMIRALRP